MNHTLSILAQANNGGAIFAGSFLILWLVLAVAALILWIWAIVDIVGSSMTSGEKLVWLLVVLFLPLIGSLLYLVMRRGGRRTTPTGT